MNIYLDEDTASPLLTRVLRRARHDIQTPDDVGLRGRSDPVELAHAVRQGRVFLTHNYGDFEELHVLIQETQGRHPGILVIRRDDDPRRNMSPSAVARALARLEAAGVPIANEHIILNAWQ